LGSAATIRSAGTGADGLKRADVALRQILARQDHRRRAEAVAGEDAGHRRAFGEAHHQQVLAVRLAHAGHGDAEVDARHGEQRRGIRRWKIDGHWYERDGIVSQ
jgi:hypothetical protein